MRRPNDEWVAIGPVKVVCMTDRAILIECDDYDDPIWIPKSQIDNDASEVAPKKGDVGVLTISKWIAEQKGLV